MLWSCHNFHDRKMLSHRHDMHELFICLNDNGLQYIGGENCEFRRGRAFFLFSGIEHYLEHQPEAPGEFVFFCFDPNHFGEKGFIKIQENIQRVKAERKFFSGIAPEYLEHNVALALQLHAEISGKNLLNEEQADAMLAQLVINYLRNVNTLKPDSVTAIDKVRVLCKKIADNPLLELSLNDAAVKTGICRTGFTKAIKDITGMSFREFVNDCRLKHACKMLTEKDTSISDAAFASGFNNLGYFHRAFKNKFGKTPFAIKKIFRQNSFPQILNEYK